MRLEVFRDSGLLKDSHLLETSRVDCPGSRQSLAPDKLIQQPHSHLLLRTIALRHLVLLVITYAAAVSGGQLACSNRRAGASH
jgi:hypothetical protein